MTSGKKWVPLPYVKRHGTGIYFLKKLKLYKLYFINSFWITSPWKVITETQDSTNFMV